MPQALDYDVFLSHGANDKAIVRMLADKLAKNGVLRWNDKVLRSSQ